tara:strand:+ start:933 stop:1304 length:372 start_codon:yes stop_codon:yes gene_type:complete
VAESRNLMQRLKEGIDDKEEQISFLSTVARLVVLAWSGAVITVAYVNIPGMPKQDFDVTFISSVFVSTLTTFGVQTAQNKNGNGNNKKQEPRQMSPEEMKAVVAALREEEESKLDLDKPGTTA